MRSGIKYDKVMLNFSGGYDSLAAAIILAPEAAELELVTFRVLTSTAHRLAKRNVTRLIKEFPGTKITHKTIDVRDVQKKLLSGFSSFADKYSAEWAPMGLWCCSCQLTMRAASIIYCARNGIKYCADGATRMEYYHSSHKIKVINQVKDLFAEYGIEYFNPVYDFPDDTEDLLRKKGYRTGIEIFAMKTIQPLCWVAFFSNIRQQASPLGTPETIVASYVRDMVPRMRELIDLRLKEKGKSGMDAGSGGSVRIEYIGGKPEGKGINSAHEALAGTLKTLFWPVYAVFGSVVKRRFR
ncbi:MAG: hypothetical protein PHT95_03700 [Candidatus Omnitrophica bacterium]|nr:hypothetical protein [Candidatus Omnitrophota bacterium]